MSPAVIESSHFVVMSPRDRQLSGYRDMDPRQSRHLAERYGNTPFDERYTFETSSVSGTRALEDPWVLKRHRGPSSDLLSITPLKPFAPSTSSTAPSFHAYESSQSRYQVNHLPPPGPYPELWPSMEVQASRHRLSTSVPVVQASLMDRWYRDDQVNTGSSPDKYYLGGEGNPSRSSLDSIYDEIGIKQGTNKPRTNPKGHPQRRPSNRDEFDGPHQFLDRPVHRMPSPQEKDMPQLSTNLLVNEQDEVLNNVNDCLSKCAFAFVAKYQFPIPLEADKRPVTTPSDREWTEWVYLLKRLATKRRIPARVLYNGQIKQFVTILENSLEMRHAAKHQSRPVKDDRNVLQLISAGLQVAKILKDPQAMEYLDRLYAQTEALINSRKSHVGFME